MPLFKLRSSKSYDLLDKCGRHGRQQSPCCHWLSPSEENIRIILRKHSQKISTYERLRPSTCQYGRAERADDSWVYVHNLKSCDDGGIFDPDDKVILAVFEEDEEAASVRPTMLDERPAVSSDSGSPWSIRTQDEHLFNACATLRESERRRHELSWIGKHSGAHRPFGDGSPTRNSSGRFHAQVDRRLRSNHDVQSPAANSVEGESDAASNACHRSTTAIVISPCSVEVNGATSSDSSSATPRVSRVKQFESEPEESSHFVRSAARKSRITDEWLDIAAKASEDWWKSQELAKGGRSESSSTGKGKKSVELSLCPLDKLNVEDFVIRPKYGSSGKLESLLIEAAKQTSTMPQLPCTNTLLVGDEIVEIHNCYVSSFSFEEYQAYRFLKTMSQDKVLKLKVLRGDDGSDNVEAAEQPRSINGFGTGPYSPRAEPKAVGILIFMAASGAQIVKGNTRKLGVQLDVRLCKEKDGLGFTVTSRDFATAELVESPVYIKNILPVGSAVKDGRLQAGDRLLKINGTSVTGKSQAEVVNMLRSIKTGEFVDLVVSRQELSVDAGPQLLDVQPIATASPRHGHRGKSATRKKFLQFDVALNETGSAGLGVSVKGRVSTKENGAGPERRDLGIFVKSIMHGGAAFKDGRLKVDDQLVAINDTSLSDYSNLAAIDRLRSAMQAVSPGAKSIRLSVLRDCVPSSAECSKSPGGSTGNESSDVSVSLDMGSASAPLSAKKQVTFNVSQRKCSISSNSNVKEQSTSAQATEQLPSSFESSKNDSPGEECSQAWSNASMYFISDALSSSSRTMDSFVRDAPGRQSMSEKRHCGAPATSHKGTAKGICSPSSPRAPISKEPMLAKRLSVSLENFSSPFLGPPGSKSIPSAVIVDPVVRLSPTKARPTNDSFRAAVGKLSDDSRPSDEASHSAADRQPIDFRASHPVSSTTSVQCGALDSSNDHPMQLERNKARRKPAVGSLSSLKNFLRWGSTGKSKVTIQKSRTASPHSLFGRPEIVEEEKQGVQAHYEGPSLPEANDRSRILYKSQVAMPARGTSPGRPVSTIQLTNSNCAYPAQKRFVPFSTTLHEEVYDTEARTFAVRNNPLHDAVPLIRRSFSVGVLTVDQCSFSETSRFVRTYKMYSEHATRTNSNYCDSMTAQSSLGKPVLRPVIPPPDYDHYLRRKSLKSKGSRKPRPMSDFHDSGSQEAFLCRDEEVLALGVASSYANGYVTRL
ncbi:hypothetical protein M513_05556 [Trichuris suis]|uniref:PDZ domain-containing protein n=1 Tax=Trichuris suis TaxID=68888 RepID=A0A085M8U4_9BILA|nr:hypothetical protein M513_05556 [Trichuris suis]